jgi:hypothetical protein
MREEGVAEFGVAADMTGLVTCSKCRHTDESGLSCGSSCLRSGVPDMSCEQGTGKLSLIVHQDTVKPHFGSRVAVTGKVEGDKLTVAAIKPASVNGR